jgi:hypothetical protein
MLKSVGLFNFIAALTHLAAVLLSKIVVKTWASWQPSPLCSSQQPQNIRMFSLVSARPAMAAFIIYTIVALTIDAAIPNITSSSAGQCHENCRVLFHPTTSQ